ncbi:hypothetical protein [Paraglaciecola sp. L3A3]|uniref:hypothetical protein n=1 Tax=Paraglaciecola sp. L3A3 TaxID=2686358 RepID=UPI00131DE87E|nr:hypothetical protein [Paraglaciecola sp. L3A3]
MKTHIFIATTQGLVAIQNITAIDDQDISSVVSVNGTSTTANISSSYHNFVKKGVGIIHQMFGACSYRVDISARIDQGNSWQVAMYLAHLAQAQGMLGNGDIKRGDKVICATGEVNTSNLHVLPVGEVAIKYKLAQPQLKQWTRLGATVLFLVPLANRAELAKDEVIQLISNLEQAAATLPAKNTQPTSAYNNSLLSKVNLASPLMLSGFILLLIIFYWGNTFTQTKHNSLPQSAIESSSANINTDKNTELVAHLQQDQDCNQTTNQLLNLTQQSFAELSLKQLCALSLQTEQSQVQVLLVAQDAYTVLPLKKIAQGWQVPLPKNRTSHRSYFLVTLDKKLIDEKVEQLRLYRETMAQPDMLTRAKLTTWLTEQDIKSTIYTHKLLKD